MNYTNISGSSNTLDSPFNFNSSQFDFPSLTPANKKAINILYGYRDLTENWDSYGAAIPSDVAIRKAIRYVQKLNESNIDVYFVVPSPNGEVLVEIKIGNINLEMEFSDSHSDTICLIENGSIIAENDLSETSFISYLKFLICPNGDCPPNL